MCDSALEDDIAFVVARLSQDALPKYARPFGIGLTPAFGSPRRSLPGRRDLARRRSTAGRLGPPRDAAKRYPS
jgi:hypothetical protein